VQWQKPSTIDSSTDGGVSLMYIAMDVLQDATDTLYGAAAFLDGELGMQSGARRGITLGVSGYAQMQTLGSQSQVVGDGQVWVPMDWNGTRSHALLLAASRRLGSSPSADGRARDCRVSAYYRSESKTSALDVDPWLLVATVDYVCDKHTFLVPHR
jgi:hypothetical protein